MDKLTRWDYENLQNVDMPAFQVARNHGEEGQLHPYRTLPLGFEFYPPALTPTFLYHPA